MELPIKKYVIIGSYALKNRYAKDIDVICYKDDIEVPAEGDGIYCLSFLHNGRRVECLLADNQSSLSYILDNSSESKRIANYAELYAIKAGHIVFPHKNWEKHMADYHFLRTVLTPKEVDSSFHTAHMVRLHRKSTKQRTKIGTPKLKGVTKEEFFDDLVTKYYEHDDIHEVMAHEDRPMFTRMQLDDGTVECHKDLWEKFTIDQKCKTVLEEAYVIALERHIIPTLKGDKIGLNNFDAFKWALMRICTTLCSGWFREFAVENYYTIINMYNPGYVDKFLESNIKEINNELQNNKR